MAAFFVGMLGASALSAALSSHPVAWQPSVGIGGPAFDRAAVQTSTVVNVEPWWPVCVSARDYTWLTPEVTYMPWSVTITLRKSAAYAVKCGEPGDDGRLPEVGASSL